MNCPAASKPHSRAISSRSATPTASVLCIQSFTPGSLYLGCFALWSVRGFQATGTREVDALLLATMTSLANRNARFEVGS